MSKTIYNIVDRNTSTFLSEPTLERNVARSTKQVLKSQGLDPVIKSTKINVNDSKIIR